MRLRAWGGSGGPVEDRLARHPLAICVSGGGFRSYACAIGQLRALHDLGVLPEAGLLSGVSGGAWALMAHAFAPARHIRNRLGRTVAPEALTLACLEQLIDDDHLAAPLPRLDTVALARRLRPKVPTARLFSRVLAAQLLQPLGIDVDRSVLSFGPEHTAELLARNPGLTREDVLERPGDRPPTLAAASLLRGAPGAWTYEPIEISPGAVWAGRPDATWPVRAIELAGLVGEPDGELLDGENEISLGDAGFGLGDLLAATGGAPGGLLVQLARVLGLEAEQLVLHTARWLAGGSPAFLVDGGYVENLGILPALRRGATRLAVFVNSNTALGSPHAPWYVHGVEGQISRLFGPTPTLGMYAGQPLPLFPEEDLPGLVSALREAESRGEQPWALTEHDLREGNPLGLEPRRVRIYWHLNEVAPSFRQALPTETQRALASPFGSLYGVPHQGVIFAHGGYAFRLPANQVALMGALHDHALRDRPPDTWERLLAP